MNQSLAVVLGMSIAYFFSLLGLLLAYFSYRRQRREKKDQ